MAATNRGGGGDWFGGYDAPEVLTTMLDGGRRMPDVETKIPRSQESSGDTKSVDLGG